MPDRSAPSGPLKSLDEWEDFVLECYPEEGNTANKFDKDFRDYDDPPRETVREFYRLNHAHRDGAYANLMNDRDKEMFKWVTAFNAYDLYSKTDQPPKLDELRPFYQELIAEYFPATIAW